MLSFGFLVELDAALVVLVFFLGTMVCYFFEGLLSLGVVRRFGCGGLGAWRFGCGGLGAVSFVYAEVG